MENMMTDEDWRDQFWLYPDDRRNIWHFNYFVAKNLYGFLGNFMFVAKIHKRDDSEWLTKIVPPTKRFGIDAIYRISDSLRTMLEEIDVDGPVYSGDTRPFLINDLHNMMALLPYMNDRHYEFSRYEYENYRGEVWCSFEDMRHLDRTIARRIAPVVRDFASCSQFPPDYFVRMYDNYRSTTACHEWRKAISQMADAWEWLAGRDDKPSTDGGWEQIPDEVYYGLHLFAEYLPEMNND